MRKPGTSVTHNGFTWQIDDFLGENRGLVVAEIELDSEDQAFDKPSWLCKEVTGKAEYFNSNLAIHPFVTWSPEQQQQDA